MAGGSQSLLPQLQNHREHVGHARVAAVRGRHRGHHVDDRPGQPQQLSDLAAGAQLHALPLQLIHGGGQHVRQV